MFQSVRYHSYGLQINPNIYMCGQVSLTLYEQTSNGSIKQKQDMWVQGTSNMLQLLFYIRDVILISNPLFNHIGYRNLQGSTNGQEWSLLYNENTIIKSLLSMVHTINKPPKVTTKLYCFCVTFLVCRLLTTNYMQNFEDFVIGHFRNRARHILMACKGYVEGGFLEGKTEEGCSITFRNDVASCIKPLVDAFIKIGAKEAKEFLPLSEIKFPLHDEQNLKKGVVSSGVTKRKSTNDGDHTAKKAKKAKKEKKTKKACFGNTGTSISNSTQVISSLAGMPTMNELSKSLIKKLIERNSSVGIYSMDDVMLDQNDDDAYNSTMARLDNIEDVEKMYKSFRKFDTVVDHSDHLFSAHSLPTKQVTSFLCFYIIIYYYLCIIFIHYCMWYIPATGKLG